MSNNIPRLIVAVTGASGSVYGRMLIRRLETTPGPFKEVAVIFSENGRNVWKYELGEEPALPAGFKEFSVNDHFAAPASGSAGYTHMVICPCSMATLAGIASGFSHNLILRAADVMLKERRKLILVPREMPYSLVHLRNMETLTLAGGIICPASPSFYSLPGSTEEVLSSVTEKICSLIGIDTGSFHWGEKQP